MFLAGHGAILVAVRTSIQKVAGYDDLLCAIVSACMTMYEQRTYLLPAEKHGCIEVMDVMDYIVFISSSEATKGYVLSD